MTENADRSLKVKSRALTHVFWGQIERGDRYVLTRRVRIVICSERDAHGEDCREWPR